MPRFMGFTAVWSMIAAVVLTAPAWSAPGVEATRQPAAAVPPPAEPRVPGTLTPDIGGAAVWTGKEIILWEGARAAAFDYEKNTWRRLAANPGARGAAQPRLLALDDGKVMAAYWSADHDVEFTKVGNTLYPHWPPGTAVQLCFDLYDVQADAWRRLGALARNDFRNEDNTVIQDFTWTGERGLELTSFPLDISNLAPVPGGAVVFVYANSAGAKTMGFQVLQVGRVSRISQKDAPQRCSSDDVAVYSRGAQVLYYCYAFVDHNEWAVWDQRTDTWSKPQSIDRRYAFGACAGDDEVFIFGGAESSAFAWIKRDGAIYSFKQNKWRDMPTENGPHGRRDFTMCWTGKDVLVWGGETLRGAVPDREKGAADAPANAVFAFSPTEGKWRLLPGKDAPSACADSLGIWTGKEMIIIGGWVPPGNTPPSNGIYAFDPKEGRWRRLPDPPPGRLPDEAH